MNRDKKPSKPNKENSMHGQTLQFKAPKRDSKDSGMRADIHNAPQDDVFSIRTLREEEEKIRENSGYNPRHEAETDHT